MKFQKGKSGNPAQQFQPGQSGNPGGRPKALLTDKLIRRLVQKDEKLAWKLADAAIRMATKNVKGLALVWERVEGRVTQPVDVSGLESLAELIAERRKAIGVTRGGALRRDLLIKAS